VKVYKFFNENSFTQALVYAGGALCHGPPQALNIKKIINTCVFLGANAYF